MIEYKILKKKAFESIEKFETRINKICRNENYKAISITTGQHQGVLALLEKTREY